MNEIYLKNNGVYFFTGENSEEKTEFLHNTLINNNIKNNSLFDIHDIRRFIFGDHYTYDLKDECIYQISYNFEDFSLIETLLNIISMRSKQGLITFINIEELNEKQLKKIKSYFLNAKIEFSFFDYTNNLKVSDKEVNKNSQLNVQNFELTHTNIDVIGDIHGLYTEFVAFITNLGYTIENEVIKHKNNRKILFLGDVIDRGQESLKMFKLMYNSVKYNGHYAIIGNHENKIVQFFKHYHKFNNIPRLNEANSETILEFLTVSQKEQQDYIDFIENLPHYYTYKNIAFIHGNIDYFEPKSVLKSKIMYGSGKEIETDIKYQKLYDEGINKYTIFHGHFSQDGSLENVFSLERKQAYAGELAIIPLDNFINDSEKSNNKESFNKNLALYKCDFDFEEHAKKFKFKDLYEKSYEDGFLMKDFNKERTLILYKHSSKIDNSNLFIFDDTLLNSNGIVFDFASNVVCNPIKKIFNYNNLPNKDFYLNNEYIFREKALGYTFNISYNFIDDNLIFSSSKFILDKRISFIYNRIKDNFYSTLFDICKLNRITLTVCFSDNKFYLINAKKCDFNNKDYSENELDELSNKIGYFKRPKYFNDNIKNIMDKINKSENAKGYIARDINKQNYLFYIENNKSKYFKFLRSINKEAKMAISTGNIHKLKYEYRDLCKFISKNRHFRDKIFSLKEIDVLEIINKFND
jgi:hypothetical protein